MTAKAPVIELGEAPFAKGDRVEILEAGIRPWQGRVAALKPSFVTGWWVDVVRDDDRMTWTVCATTTDIRLLPRQGS
jgi:hypothetical protein